VKRKSEGLVTEVIFIGSSDAFGAGGRRQSAILLRNSQGTALIDCGGTTLTGLAQLGIARNEIDAILVSHYHGDHFMGIPQFLLASIYEDSRSKPLHIAGPRPIEQRVRTLAQAVGYPMEDRNWNFPIHFHDLEAGEELPVGPISVTPFQTHHQLETCPHGLSLHSEGRQIVFSGDTGWFEELPKHTQGSDLFICECTTYDRGFEYHMNFRDLYENREAFGADRIILTHLGPTMTSRRGSCAMETADDGLRILLEDG